MRDADLEKGQTWGKTNPAPQSLIETMNTHVAYNGTSIPFSGFGTPDHYLHVTNAAAQIVHLLSNIADAPAFGAICPHQLVGTLNGVAQLLDIAELSMMTGQRLAEDG
jgi:hypothetical protein